MARLVRAIYDDDLQRGYVTVLGEMVAGGVSDPPLGAAVAARIEPWIDMVEGKLEQLLAVSALAPLCLAAEWPSGSSRLLRSRHAQPSAGDPSRAESLLDLATHLAALADTFLPQPRASRHEPDTPTDLVTGAFSYSGARSRSNCWIPGADVRTLTFHPDRAHPLRRAVETLAYRFDDPAALARSLEGVSTLFNTYWVRFDHGHTTFANAVENSRTLFHAAERAGVARIVHVSITNPALDSPLPYFRGKALVERRSPSRASPTRSSGPRGSSAASATC